MLNLTPKEMKIYLSFTRANAAMKSYKITRDRYKKFNYLKDIILNCTECTPRDFTEAELKSKDINDTYIYQLKLLKITRHILAHFPFFERARDIFIDFDMMKSESGGNSICNFFKNAPNGQEDCDYIYDSTEHAFKQCYIIIPQMHSGDKVMYSSLFKFKPHITDEHEGLYIVALMSFALFKNYIRSLDRLAGEVHQW